MNIRNERDRRSTACFSTQLFWDCFLTWLSNSNGHICHANALFRSYYPHGEKVICDPEVDGRSCRAPCDTEGCEQFFATHTCSILSFCPSSDATETVYELPDDDAIRDCDFSSAVALGEMNGAESADDGCFRYSFEEDHELTDYFFASKEGCEQGQRLKVKVEDFSMTADQCIKIGLTTPRIRNCDCRLQKQASTLGVRLPFQYAYMGWFIDLWVFPCRCQNDLIKHVLFIGTLPHRILQ